MKIKEFLKLARIEHAIFLALAVIVGEVVVTSRIELLPSLFGVLSVFFIGIGSFTLNDFLDYKTDKKNKRKDRPLVNGSISMWSAIAAAKVCFPLGILFALLINMNCFWIAAIFSILAVAYSYILKKILLLGNAFVAFSMAVPFLFGNYIVSNQIAVSIQILSSIAFLTGLGREIIKSIQDMTGDKKYGRWTLPIALGKKLPLAFAIIYILLAVVMSFIPFLVLPKFYHNIFYLAPIIVTDMLLLKSAYLSAHLKKLEKVRKMSLLAIGIGLIGFLLGALV